MFTDINDSQRRQFIDAEQARGAWLSAEQRAFNYRGSIYWHQSKGHTYLYREYDKSQRKSLGPKSLETEKIYNSFKSEKASARERFRKLKETIATHERLNVALRIGQTPNVVIALLEAIRKAGLQDNLLVIGTNALFAYEAYAGVRFRDDVVAMSGASRLRGARKKITILADADDQFLNVRWNELFQKVDQTFKIEETKCKAANFQGCTINVLMQRPLPHLGGPEQHMDEGRRDDFWTTKTRSLDWLLSSPRFRQVVIGANGKMAEMVTIDPRAFVLFKVTRAQMRNHSPGKAARDMVQAKAVYNLLQERMPHFSFDRINIHAELPTEIRAL